MTNTKKDNKTDLFDLKKIRISLNMTCKEFSDSLRLTREQEKLLKDWENGKVIVPENVRNKALSFPTGPTYKMSSSTPHRFTQIDLFAGIGGIRLGFQQHGGKTVFSSEWNKFSQKTYSLNYGEVPVGDITEIDPISIPDHDVLLAGFPCQPFSQAGKKMGFEDTRGTLFFNVANIIKEKRPKAFMLENVKNLKSHDHGNTLKVILNTLKELNYYVPEPVILNSNHFGLPQKRERIFIVGFNRDILPPEFKPYIFPKGEQNTAIKVGNILESEVPERFTISDKIYQGHLKRKMQHKNKGNGFGFSLFNKNSLYTNTISARYYKDGSEALIEQEGKNPRMLTPRECARLQGFPEDFIIGVSNTQAYKQFGNSVSVNVVSAIASSMIDYLEDLDVLKHNN